MSKISSNSTRTSGRRRMNYASDSERSKRLNANMIERRRMQNINSGFSSLKKLLPPSDRKQTKAAILQQASQHILRLQRAIIQFKTENDTLRSTLEMKNQAMACSKRAHNGPQHIQYSTKPADAMTSMECDHLSKASPRNTYERSLLPRSMHKEFGDDGGWRMFEHVKKFKPASAKRSSFHDHHEVCHTHGIDFRPPTPPVSPPLEDHVIRSRGDVIARTPASLAPKLLYPTCEQLQSRYPPPKGIPRQDIHLPEKNIFSSSSQTTSNSKPVRVEKRKSSRSKERSPSTGEGAKTGEEMNMGASQPDEETEKGAKSDKGRLTGDLQCIIDAIYIIENSEYSCTGDRS